jgi:hypothetical protein
VSLSTTIKENLPAVIVTVFIAMATLIGTLAALNARNFIEGIAAEVYAEQGLEPSTIKGQLIALETKLENVEGDVGEVRQDIRALIQSL